MSSTRRLILLPFQRPPTGVCDAEARNLGRLARGPYGLGVGCRQSFTGKTGEHFGREPIGYEDRLAEAAWDACE
jgi:hypothetical protein